MAIRHRSDSPKNAHDVIGKALSDIADSASGAIGGGAVNLDLADPLPIYLLGLADIKTSETPLSAVKLVGWRYLLERPDNGQVGYADVQDRDRHAQFVSITGSEVANTLLDAAHIAQSAAAKLHDDVELRIIEAPAVKKSALWLSDGADVFISYIDGAPKSPLKLRLSSVIE